MSSEKSFLQHLIDKQAATIRAGINSGGNFSGAIEEVNRQIKQTSPKDDGDPISGKGVTKSGGDD